MEIGLAFRRQFDYLVSCQRDKPTQTKDKTMNNTIKNTIAAAINTITAAWGADRASEIAENVSSTDVDATAIQNIIAVRDGAQGADYAQAISDVTINSGYADADDMIESTDSEDDADEIHAAYRVAVQYGA